MKRIVLALLASSVFGCASGGLPSEVARPASAEPSQRLSGPPLEKACEFGSPKMCLVVAGMVARGQGCPSNQARALALFEAACERGSAEGCVEAASQYETGRGTSRDVARAIDLYGKACGGGSARGCSARDELLAKRSLVPAGAVSARE
jgi:TPR repeat protein